MVSLATLRSQCVHPCFCSVIGYELLSSLKEGTSITDKDCAYARNAEQHTDNYALKKSEYQKEKKVELNQSQAACV